MDCPIHEAKTKALISSNDAVDMRLRFRICKNRVSRDMAHIINTEKIS